MLSHAVYPLALEGVKERLDSVQITGYRRKGAPSMTPKLLGCKQFAGGCLDEPM